MFVYTIKKSAGVQIYILAAILFVTHDSHGWERRAFLALIRRRREGRGRVMRLRSRLWEKTVWEIQRGGGSIGRGGYRSGFFCVTRPPSFLADSPRMGEKGRNALDIHIHNK